MSTNIREPRNAQVIKAKITPASTALKTKLSTAFQTIITKIKAKHIGE